MKIYGIVFTVSTAHLRTPLVKKALFENKREDGCLKRLMVFATSLLFYPGLNDFQTNNGAFGKTLLIHI